MNNIKRVLALLTVVLTLFAFVGCNKKGEQVTTAPVQEGTEVIITEDVYEPETDVAETEAATELVTEPVTQQNSTNPPKQETTAQAATEAATKAPSKPETTTKKPVATTKPATTKPAAKPETTTKKPAATTKPAAKPETTTKKPVATKPATTKPAATKPATTKPKPTTTKPIVAPSSKADIVKLYNTAANTAASKKPGYSKTVNTSISNISMGALSKIKAVKEVVGDFLGEGKSSSKVNKGSFDGVSLVKSTLTASDVASATCKLSADKKYYIVEITVKNETNPLKGKSALGRFTKDYKDVDEIRSGINEAGAKVDGITIKTSAVKITAKIAVGTNRFESLSHSFKMSATLTNVKYSIAKVKSASANLSTTVSYSGFKY